MIVNELSCLVIMFTTLLINNSRFNHRYFKVLATTLPITLLDGREKNIILEELVKKEQEEKEALQREKDAAEEEKMRVQGEKEAL